MQMSIFDGSKEFSNSKPIRLIELFAGYGSQALALKYLGVQFEHWRISEWAVKSIQAYKDLHAHSDTADHSRGIALTEIRKRLYGRISQDYSTPLTDAQIDKLSERQARAIYSNMRATNNLGSITQIKAEDLAVTDTDKYCYVMTYSYPCQDCSNAGKGAGMAKGSGTRSALLWEVERPLNEMTEKPQILLMENVPQVHGEKNKDDFYAWCNELEEMGYHNYWKDLNSKDFGIPQNRNRCFMISVLGDYFFTFPKQQKLTVRLKDFLDRKVDEKYYLSDATLEMFIEHTKKQQAKGNGFKFEPSDGGGSVNALQLAPGAEPMTILLSNQGTVFERETDISATICARDYKGFGNQAMTAVVENAGGGQTVSSSGKPRASSEGR